MRIFETIGDLVKTVDILPDTDCWWFLKKSGERYGPNAAPTVWTGQAEGYIQVAVIAFKLAGGTIPEGHSLRRTSKCIRFCCNPDHLSTAPGRVGVGKGRPSHNPAGTPSALKPNGGRAPGTPRPWRQGIAAGGRLKKLRGLPLDKDRAV